MEKITQTAQENLTKALQSLADNFEPIIDKLAGTQSIITLSFKDLTLDTGKAKATLTGTINLTAAYTEQQGTQISSASDVTQVDRTVVNVE